MAPKPCLQRSRPCPDSPPPISTLKTPPPPNFLAPWPDRLLLALAVGSLGLSAFVTQVTLTRELMGVLSGNELVFGIVLGVWLLWTGAGSALGRWVGAWKGCAGVFVACKSLSPWHPWPAFSCCASAGMRSSCAARPWAPAKPWPSASCCLHRTASRWAWRLRWPACSWPRDPQPKASDRCIWSIAWADWPAGWP